MRARAILTGALTGVLSVGAAYAGVGLSPLARTAPDAATAVIGDARIARSADAIAAGTPVTAAPLAETAAVAASTTSYDESVLGANELFAGAAKVEPGAAPGREQG